MIKLGQTPSNVIKFDQSGPNWTNLDQTCSNWINRIKPEKSGLNWIEPHQTWLNLTWSHLVPCFGKFGIVFVRRSETIRQSLEDLIGGSKKSQKSMTYWFGLRILNPFNDFGIFGEKSQSKIKSSVISFRICFSYGIHNTKLLFCTILTSLTKICYLLCLKRSVFISPICCNAL